MTEKQKDRLWSEYKKTKDSKIREQLIIEYAPLIKLVAGRLSMYLGFNVEYEDLCSYGIFGLIDAIDKFELLKDIKFETYASIRIRGAILDQIRQMDWIPRTVREKQKKIDAAIKEIEGTTGHQACDDEVAEKLGITSKEYMKWQDQINVGLVSLNEFMENGNDTSEDISRITSGFDKPEDAFIKQEIKEKLKEGLETLNEREKKVILLYYYEELTAKEIAGILEVSESRISQIHSRAVQKLKQCLGVYEGILADFI